MVAMVLYKYVCYQARVSAGLSQIKKIPYQAPPSQLGARKCTFWKNAFLGPKYQCKDFFFLENLKITRRNFLCFEFSTTLPKNGPKNGPKFKKRRKITKTTLPLEGDPI